MKSFNLQLEVAALYSNSSGDGPEHKVQNEKQMMTEKTS